jgi:hypothetical protein
MVLDWWSNITILSLQLQYTGLVARQNIFHSKNTHNTIGQSIQISGNHWKLLLLFHKTHVLHAYSCMLVVQEQEMKELFVLAENGSI